MNNNELLVAIMFANIVSNYNEQSIHYNSQVKSMALKTKHICLGGRGVFVFSHGL